MRCSEELSIAGENGHGDPIWGKLEMSAHRKVSRRVYGWRLESRSRRSCGRVLVDSNAARSAFELAGVSSRRRLRCGLVSGEREREEGGNGRVHFARGAAVEVMRMSGANERGQRRRTGAKCRRCSDAGRSRRRARRPFRQNDDRLTELL